MTKSKDNEVKFVEILATLKSEIYKKLMIQFNKKCLMYVFKKNRDLYDSHPNLLIRVNFDEFLVEIE